MAERSKNKKRNLIEYFGAWRVPPSTPPGLSPRTCWASPEQSIKGANYFLLYAPPEPVTTTVSMAWILSIPSYSHQPRFRGGRPSWSTQSTMEQPNWGSESVGEHLVEAQARRRTRRRRRQRGQAPSLRIGCRKKHTRFMKSKSHVSKTIVNRHTTDSWKAEFN